MLPQGATFLASRLSQHARKGEGEWARDNAAISRLATRKVVPGDACQSYLVLPLAVPRIFCFHLRCDKVWRSMRGGNKVSWSPIAWLSCRNAVVVNGDLEKWVRG